MAFSALGSEFYHSPNFRGFNDIENFKTTTSKYYDSETESDILTYSPINCGRQRLLSQATDFFCTSNGSLGSKRFLTDSYFILTEPLLPKTLFRLHWVQNQDFSEDTQALAPELLFSLSDKNSIGVHGQVDSQKSKDDVGISYNLSLDDFWMRTEVTAIDFSRNERNENSDRFSQNPFTASLMTLKKVGDDLYSLNFHIEPQFVWKESNGKTVSRTRSWTALTLSKDKSIYTLDYVRSFLEINADFEDHTLLRGHWQMGLEQWTPGLRLVQKTWSEPNGTLIQYDALPFVWYRPMETLKAFDFGYEFTIHHSQDRRTSVVYGNKTKIENRGNVAWTAIETKTATKKANLKFLFTFDLDQLGSGETWEGGNGQFTLFF